MTHSTHCPPTRYPNHERSGQSRSSGWELCMLASHTLSCQLSCEPVQCTRGLLVPDRSPWLMQTFLGVRDRQSPEGLEVWTSQWSKSSGHSRFLQVGITRSRSPLSGHRPFRGEVKKLYANLTWCLHLGRQMFCLQRDHFVIFANIHLKLKSNHMNPMN